MSDSAYFGPPKQVATDINQFSPELLEQMAQYFETRGFRTPISQVVGFSTFLAAPAADVLTSESTSSLTYVDLATVGPQLTGLGAGSYVLFFSFLASNAGFMAPSLNGAAASDSQSAQNGNAAGTTGGVRAVPVTVSLDNNTITMKYRTSGAATNFSNRWLLALRYANR